ncbi:hypothetical protein PybrP1_010236 [[Pythium] brassicae (nom. inval.)]|nr:hypothetical protein PybrP1_010236 [[Pythium] brassicae (nom. inval.)]
MVVKLLLCGRVRDAAQWRTVFERVQKLNAAAAKSKAPPFTLLLVAGGALPTVLDMLQAPVPTFVVDASDTSESMRTAPEQVAENLFALRGHGVVTIHGLKVAFLCDKAAHAAQVKELAQELETQSDVDFLLTAEYAAGFQRLLPDAQLPTELRSTRGADALQALLRVAHPRYHITSCASDADSSGDVFYQRLPYVSENRGSGRKCVTRLIGLCGVNTSKDKARKYLHALQVTPSAAAGPEQAVDIPAGTTQNPYEEAARALEQRSSRDEPPSKRHKPEAPAASASSGGGGLSAEQIAELTAKSASGAQFFYDQKIAARGQRQGALRQDLQQQQQRDNRRRPPPVPERAECWFCLATPSVERHLIVSIGQEAYLAMPKGAINGDHLLIVPIAHEPATTTLSAATWAEIERFKRALRDLFWAQGKEMLVLDRNVQTIGAAHCHLQVVGVPRVQAAAARQVFESESERYHVRFEELATDTRLQEATGGRPFFYAEVPAPPAPSDDESDVSGSHRVVRLLNIVDGKHFMQFGRHAAACVLDVPRRANWKNCVVSKAEEEQMTQAFKTQWKPFDFTLEDADDE